MKIKWRQVVHWALIANFVLAALYGAYMVFFGVGGARGPLLNRAPDTPTGLVIKRRLYAIETWVTLFALSVYLAITEILPRRIAAAREGDDRSPGNRKGKDTDASPGGRPSFSIGAFATIFDERGRVLLCHRRDLDLWNLPGGGVESGELPTEAVIRETKEETGLDVTIEQLVGVYGKPDKDDIVFSFTCHVVGGQLSVTAEADECRYFEVEQIPPNTSPRQVERIHDALDPTPQPLLRRQHGPSTKQHLQHLQRQASSGQLHLVT